MTKGFSNIWDLKKFPDGVEQTVQRPSGEGYSQDAEFALKIQNMKSQRRAAKVAEDAADAASRVADAAEDKSVNCLSNYMGGFRCY